MSTMSTMGRRVALLARPGVACDRLRGALAEAGADLVLEADPLTLDPAMLDAARAQVVLVALDPQTEEALDRFEAALQDPAIEVIFEEAELAARREGWEAARWTRHLAAKLHRHGDVLPPGGEPGSAASMVHAVGDGRTTTELESESGDFSFEVVVESEAKFESVPLGEPAAVATAYAFDPLLAEIDFDAGASLLATVADVDSQTLDSSAVFDPSLDFSYVGDFDTVETDMSVDLVVASGDNGFSVDQGDFLPSGDLSFEEPSGRAGEASRNPEFSPLFDGDFAARPSEQDAAGLANSDINGATGEPVGDKTKTKRVLELVSTDPEMDSGPRGVDDASDEGIVADHRFKHDLASLESRIAGMELVDDRVVKGPAQANGAVLVMAGIGGPDAVRQLLGALPENFPRPVLVQQRLDGGRYDKLVAQMQRATKVLVKLAEPGQQAIAGVIYILPAAVGIHVEEAGIQFTGGDDNVLAALPSADSAVLLLSGSDPAQVDAVLNHSWAGALVIGQSPDGCYDAAAPSALVARGGGCGQPAELAERLSERWRS